MQVNQFRFLTVVLVLFVLFSGCRGKGLLFRGIEGPDSVDERSSATFEVNASGDRNITYQWAVDPPSAGQLMSPQAGSTLFMANDVEQDLEIHIRVTITSLKDGPYVLGKAVTINEIDFAPDANAYSDKSLVLAGEPVHFFDDSSDPEGADDIVKWEWDFNYSPFSGFDTESSDRNPVHIYDTPGEYLVQLRVTDEKGLSDMLDDPLEIRVVGSNEPHASAYADRTIVLPGETVNFFDESDDPDGVEDIVLWEWDFDYGPGDFIVMSTEREPSHQYMEAGIYSVQLRVTDSTGLRDMLDEPLVISVVEHHDPVAMASVEDDYIKVMESVYFHDESEDPDGVDDIVRWEWDFTYDPVDGFITESEERNPVHSYSESGIYHVQLRVTDSTDLQDMLDEPLSVVVAQNVPPIAAAHADTYFTKIAEVIHFYDDSSDPDGYDDIVKWEWDFSFNGLDGFQVDATEPDPDHAYMEDGFYLVQLKVTDSVGNTDTLDDPLEITISVNNPPVADASADLDEIPTGGEVAFTDLSTDPDGDDTIVKWEWDFDYSATEGFTMESEEQNPTWQFDEPGSYYIQLRVTDAGDLSDMLDFPLHVDVMDNEIPVITSIIRNRTTSQGGNGGEVVVLEVVFEDDIPPGDTHTFEWSSDHGYFGNPDSSVTVWYQPEYPVVAELTVEVIDSFGQSDSMSCNQWVTQYPAKIINDLELIPSENLPDAFGDPVDPRDFCFPDAANPDGNVIFITVWTSWSGYNIMEMPDLTAMYHKYEAEDYVHIMLNLMESESLVINFVNNHNFEATYWLLDPTGVYFSKLNDWNSNSSGIPQHWVFDRDGRCRYSNIGAYTTGTDSVEAIIDELIQ